MARYDYGMRGPGDTNVPRRNWSERGYDYDQRSNGAPHPGRVTARYNQDYVHERGPSLPWNPYTRGADRPGRIAGEEDYQQPYLTKGGTWTYRGGARFDPYQADYFVERRQRNPDDI